jgi:hypothetical protein
MSFFAWVFTTLTTGLTAGLTWLGIHTKRLNDLNLKIELAKQLDGARDEKISDIQTDIKEIRKERKTDMAYIREKWEAEFELHQKTLFENQKLSACLIQQTETIERHGQEIELLHNNNLKLSKSKK